MKIEVHEEMRQMILLAVAELELERPGWKLPIGEIVELLQGCEMFESFKHSNSDRMLEGLRLPFDFPIRARRIAQEDPELIDWLLGIANGKPTEPGSFVKAIADLALRADAENYPVFRPALLAMKKKYPQYRYEARDLPDPDPQPLP